jgi:hypothetical protein
MGLLFKPMTALPSYCGGFGISDGYRAALASERGHPLGRVSTGKKNFVPNFLFSNQIRFAHCCPSHPSCTRHSDLSFRRLIPDAPRRAIACAEAIRSVTHLVLALAGR